MKKYIIYLQVFFVTICNFILVIFLLPSKIFNSKKLNFSNYNLIIIGNGESINTNIKELVNHHKKYKILCVNYFLNSHLFPKLKPDLYCLTDKVFFKKTNDKIIQKKKNNLKRELIKINYSMILLIPWNYRFSNFINFIQLNKNIKIKYIPNIPILDGIKPFSQFLINNNFANPLYENVMIAAIYSSIRYKFKNIFLFGVEHDWIKSLIVNNNNELFCGKKFFYESENNKILRDSFGNDIKLADIIYDFHHIIKSYHLLNKMALYNNIKIINCCENSMIDGFKKGTLN